MSTLSVALLVALTASLAGNALTMRLLRTERQLRVEVEHQCIGLGRAWQAYGAMLDGSYRPPRKLHVVRGGAS